MKSFLNYKPILAAGIAALMLAAPAVRSMADDGDGTVTPSKTTVMLLPVLDTSVDGQRFAGLHEAIVLHRAEYEFLTRQFTMIGPALATAEARKAGVNATDPTQRTSDTLDKLAKATGADWVVSLVVLEYKHDTFTPGNRTDDVKLHLLVYDEKGGAVLADKDVITQKNSGGQNIGVLGLIVATLDVGAKSTLKNLLDPYPETVKVSNEFGTEDYLLGQTKPVTGDPKTPFTDLGAPGPSTGSVQIK